MYVVKYFTFCTLDSDVQFDLRKEKRYDAMNIMAINNNFKNCTTDVEAGESGLTVLVAKLVERST